MFVDLMRDKAKAMPTIPDAASTTALRVWHCNYVSLAPMVQFRNLTILVVATYPDADLEPLVSLTSLKYLSILHLPNVTDLAPLAKLTHLSTVRLATLPGWDSSGKVTEVLSLHPLAGLPRLTHPELFGVRPASKSLHDLEGAANLASVRVSKYPKAEVARFRDATGLSDAFARRLVSLTGTETQSHAAIRAVMPRSARSWRPSVSRRSREVGLRLGS